MLQHNFCTSLLPHFAPLCGFFTCAPFRPQYIPFSRRDTSHRSLPIPLFSHLTSLLCSRHSHEYTFGTRDGMSQATKPIRVSDRNKRWICQHRLRDRKFEIIPAPAALFRVETQSPDFAAKFASESQSDGEAGEGDWLPIHCERTAQSVESAFADGKQAIRRGCESVSK